MALIQSTAIPSAATDYDIGQSLRFKDTAKNGTGSYLSRKPVSEGNRKRWTYSCWAKGLPAPNTNSHETQILLSADGGTGHYLWLSISNDGTLDFRQWDNGSGYYWRKISTALYRDPSSWYHFVVVYDSANGTAEDRIKMYVNGERITSFGTNTNPDQNTNSFVNDDDKFHSIGRFSMSGAVQSDGALNGYLAEVNFIDGLVKAPADFGETGDYGEWKPTAYTGTYGTNGFYLNFAGGGIMSATGGNSTGTTGNYKYKTYTSSGTFTPSAEGYVEYLVVGGGGGGGHGLGGGGGAGGFKTGYLQVTGSTAYTVTVGAGGAYDTSGSDSSISGTGITTLTSTGGGRGGGSNDPATGGSGGGGRGIGSGSVIAGASGTSGQGNAGGNGVGSNGFPAGGGGGAGAAGANGVGSGAAGNGGVGLQSNIDTNNYYYAAGGGGGAHFDPSTSGGNGGTGGAGGGARGGGSAGSGGGSARNAGSAGGTGDGGVGGAAGANTGSGGGGGAWGGGNGGAGGSGIVIIRYKFQ